MNVNELLALGLKVVTGLRLEIPNNGGEVNVFQHKHLVQDRRSTAALWGVLSAGCPMVLTGRPRFSDDFLLPRKVRADQPIHPLLVGRVGD